MDYNKYSKDVHTIIDNLSKEESNHIGNGYWVDSNHIIYRKVEYAGNKPVGFIDVYSLPKFKRYGLIIIAVSKEARGKGIGKKLVNSAIQNCKNNKDIDKLRWLADSNNIASINMAKSLGFKLNDDGEDKKEFIYDLKNNKFITEASTELHKDDTLVSMITEKTGKYNRRRILLTSTGFTNKNIEKIFIDNIHKPLSDVKVIFVPTAANDPESKSIIPECYKDLTNAGISDKNIMWYDLDRQMTLSEIMAYDAIYFCGGSEKYLIKRINQINFEPILISAINNGIFFIGVSAGSMIVSDSVKNGLGIIKNKLEPHCEKNIALNGNINLNDNTQIRLSDNQALWIYGDRSIIVESCKDVETARKFLQEVDNLSKKYDANFFIVTDGASMTRNGRGKSEPAVKNARDNQIEWEKKNGGNPDEDWLKHINESTLPSKERNKLDDDVLSLGFKLNNDKKDKKEFIYDLRGDENMSDLYENMNENAATVAAVGLHLILVLRENRYCKEFNNYAKQRCGDELILMSDLTHKRIASSIDGLLKKNWTINHPTELVDFLQKYDNELYNKYKDKNIIFIDQYSLKNDKPGNIFFVSISVFNPFNHRYKLSLNYDRGIEPVEYKYIPINSISKKYSAYYIIGSLYSVDRNIKDILNKTNDAYRFGIRSNETDFENIVESKYPQVKEFKKSFYDSLKNNKSKKTDDKSTTNTKDKNKISKETNVNESTLPSKERNKLDDDEDKKEFIYDLRGECITESCKDVETARKFLQEVDDLSKKYDANFFIVTDGASMTRNGRGKSEPAVKNARNKQIEWEKKNGGNPDEDWLKHINESTLPSKERSKLDDDAFGIPSLRKYPLNDKAHVLAAIRMFNRVDRKHEKELAHNIIAAMEKYKISKDIIGPKNRLQSYI